VETLERLFNPGSIGIIGASSNDAAVGGRALRALVDYGYTGDIVPINPQREEILGLRCWPSITDYPGEIDVALILLDPKRTVAAVEQVAEKGVPFAVLLSAGYSEVGSEGRRMQDSIVAIAGASALRFVGPNCGGLVNVTESIPMGFFPSLRLGAPKRGGVALITQSGGVGAVALNKAHDKHIGLSRMVTTGNEADLSSGDFMQWLATDDATTTVAAYIEGLAKPGAFLEGLAALHAAGKPVVLMKGGQSESGRATAESHTAVLAPSYEILKSVAQEYGVTLVNDIDDLLDIAAFLDSAPPYRSGATVGVTTSGGMAVMLADQLSENDVEAADISDATEKVLSEILPPFAHVRNPVDITAQYLNDPKLFERTITALSADPNIACIAPALAMVGDNAETMADQLIELHTQKPDIALAVSWSRSSLVEAGPRRLREAGIPVFERLDTAAKGIAAYTSGQRAGVTDTEPSRQVEVGTTPTEGHVPVPAGDVARPEFGIELMAEMERLGVPVAPITEYSPTSDGHAAQHYPVVVKGFLPGVGHKSDAGLVIAGIGSGDELEAAIHSMQAAAGPAEPQLRIGLQPMISGAVAELIMAVRKDSHFGWRTVVGIGGLFAEVLADTRIMRAPITQDEAVQAISGLRAYSLLNGYRGRPVGDVAAAAGVLTRLSELTGWLDAIGEAKGQPIDSLELNPVLVLPDGGGAWCVDALVATSPAK